MEEKEKRREKEHHRKQLDESNIKALLKTMSSAPTQGAKSNLSSNIGRLLFAVLVIGCYIIRVSFRFVGIV